MPNPESSIVHATLSDHASLDDLLGYGPYVATLDELLTQPSVATPFAVGVYGLWGTGKSSFMLQLHERLERKGLPAVWFQPWLFDEKEEVWKALILSILQYLEDMTEDRTQITRIKDLVMGVGRIALNQAMSKATGLDLTVDQIAHAYSSASSDNTRFINTFRRDFEQVKDAVLSKDTNANSRLYVFVDDLDRCTPENCVRVLEAIRLFFDLDGCLFILGIDHEVVQKGIEVKYDRHLKMRGRDYLDKLIQLPFTLPPISAQSFDSFIHATTAPFKFQEQSRQLIALASERNPRRVKRLSNCLELLRTAARAMAKDGTGPNALDKPDTERHLAFLLALQVRFPIANRWLMEHLEYIADADALNQAKHALVAWLSASYSEEAANEVADEVVDFVNRAQRDGLIARDWKGKEALVRVTALVDTGSGEAERPKRLIIDSQYAQTESDEDETEPALGGPGTPEPTAQHRSEEQIERTNSLVEEVKDAVASFNDVLQPSVWGVLFGVKDSPLERASDQLDIVVHTVKALEQVDSEAVPIRAGIITGDGGRKKMMRLARYLVRIGWTLAGIGFVLLLAAGLIRVLYGGGLESSLALWLTIAFGALGLALYLRGLMVALNGRRKLRTLDEDVTRTDDQS